LEGEADLAIMEPMSELEAHSAYRQPEHDHGKYVTRGGWIDDFLDYSLVPPSEPPWRLLGLLPRNVIDELRIGYAFQIHIDNHYVGSHEDQFFVAACVVITLQLQRGDLED